ncbi:MAG: mechanosensitive ion channel family protein, partial [Oscillospiraceae bacterium]
LGIPTEWFSAAAMTVIRAVVVFCVGCAAINLVLKFLRRLLATTRLDPTIQPFLCHAAQAALYVVLVIGCVDILGIPTASVVAAIASAGVALSLSVKDHLSNLIGGLVVLVTKPFSKGDYIELDGCDGVVEEIGLIYTVLRTYDARRIYVPNNDAAKAKIINHSAEPIRRLDMTFPIGYQDDFAQAQTIILRVAGQTGLVLPEPAPLVRMNAYGASSVEIICRLWTSFDHLYELKYQMAEQVKIAFDQAGISIPYHQLDLHVIQP